MQGSSRQCKGVHWRGGARPVVGMPRPAIGFTPLLSVHQLPLSLDPISSKSPAPPFIHLRQLNFPPHAKASPFSSVTSKSKKNARQAEQFSLSRALGRAGTTMYSDHSVAGHQQGKVGAPYFWGGAPPLSAQRPTPFHPLFCPCRGHHPWLPLQFPGFKGQPG